MVFFELPGTEIRDIPLFQEDAPLSLVFVEIGCHPGQKRAQLRSRQDTFQSYWESTYHPQGITWHPTVRRMLAHYDPIKFQKGVFNCEREYNPDVVVYYRDIPSEVLLRLDTAQIEELLTLDRRTVELAEELIAHPDAQYLHELILHDSNQRTARFRGKVAEMIALNTVQDHLPEGCRLFRNSDVRFFHDTMSNGVEVDGMVVMYGDDPFWTLVDRIKGIPYLTVETNREIPR